MSAFTAAMAGTSFPPPIRWPAIQPPRSSGWLGGVQLGYNYQIGAFVLGVEGEYSWSTIKQDTPDPLGPRRRQLQL